MYGHVILGIESMLALITINAVQRESKKDEQATAKSNSNSKAPYKLSRLMQTHDP